jgi:hypothetical protein
MIKHNITPVAAINYDLIRYEADDRLYRELRVYWPDVCAALNLGSEDEYDGTREDELCQILLASGAPNWVADPTCSYCDEVAWITWDETPTDDDLVRWAMFHPKVAGSTDDLEVLRERQKAWEYHCVIQTLPNGDASH